MNSHVEGSALSTAHIASGSQLPSNVPEVTGWLLAEAQTALEPGGCTIQIIETTPPQRKASPNRAAEYSTARKPVRVPVFGDWRVLRCQSIRSDGEPMIELLVARELLGETRADHHTITSCPYELISL